MWLSIQKLILQLWKLRFIASNFQSNFSSIDGKITLAPHTYVLRLTLNSEHSVPSFCASNYIVKTHGFKLDASVTWRPFHKSYKNQNTTFYLFPNTYRL